ncbi:hypothetical protein F0L68_15855 [Solihabitans fulvus]|uniref:Lipoprotein n=1 Tax=Solihabitans fulvus TaxID=1892852 RepID=A0A5B2XDG4_9PSEU|nr:hypothetical protein [Solihabitans fulvus]KAA2261717.1 hypothetical protein F0L68_15855 [Solihabitans fulvus]
MTRRTSLFAALLAVAALCGCSAQAADAPAPAPSRTSAGPTDRSPTEAKALADTYFGLLAGGGWSRAWDLWTAAARRSVTKEEFAGASAACRTARGVPYRTEQLTLVDRDTAVVPWTRAAVHGSNRILFEDGAWHIEPTEQQTHPDRSCG